MRKLGKIVLALMGCLFLGLGTVNAQSLTVGWDWPTNYTDNSAFPVSERGGINVYYGTASRTVANYTFTNIYVGNVASGVVYVAAGYWYLSGTCYGTNVYGITAESDLSSEVVLRTASKPTKPMVNILASGPNWVQLAVIPPSTCVDGGSLAANDIFGYKFWIGPTTNTAVVSALTTVTNYVFTGLGSSVYAIGASCVGTNLVKAESDVAFTSYSGSRPKPPRLFGVTN